MRAIFTLALLIGMTTTCVAGNLGHQKPIREVLLMKAPVADEVYVRDAIDGTYYRIIAYDEEGKVINGMKQTEINSIISRPKVWLKIYKGQLDR